MATADSYGLFWNSDSGDRKYNADSFERWLRKFFTSGVFEGDLQVLASSGMTVNIQTGYCNLFGKVGLFEVVNSITLDAANSRYPRIDTIVVERNDTDRIISLKKVNGSYSGENPQPTAPIWDETQGVYQLVLAQIYIGAGVSAITQSNITDTRTDSNLCGYITGTVEEIDFAQITAQFEQYFAEFEQSNFEEFETWFEHMKDQLDTDAAGHLQNEIDGIQDEIGALSDLETSDKSNLVAAINEEVEQSDELVTEMAVVNNVLSAKNQLPNQAINNSINGLRFTVNSDGSVIVNGTSTATTVFTIAKGDIGLENNRTYIYSGLPATSSSKYLQYYYGDGTPSVNITSVDGGTITPSNHSAQEFRIVVTANQTLSNYTFKPMLRLSSIQDGTYTPYSKTTQELTGEVDPMMNVLGAKNLLPNNAVTQTSSGITFTVNADGTVKVNGTATAGTSLELSTITYPKGDYVLTGCPTNGSVNTYRLSIIGVGSDIGSGYKFSLSEDTTLDLKIVIVNGTTASNLVFKPMIRPASIKDNTYVPYAMTNRELTNVTSQINSGLAFQYISGSTSYSGNYLAYKWGHIVELTVQGITNSTLNQNMTIMTLPVGFRPKHTIFASGRYTSGNLSETIHFNILTTGGIGTYSYKAFSNGCFCVTYMVD